ncbi:MAG: hypothetical protein AAB676_16715 [Verrucomicrobiota bacterium]
MKAEIPLPAQPLRKKRRWLLYAGIALGVLVLLAGTLLVLGVSYWNSLIRTYTETKPKQLSAVDSSPEAKERLQRKWAEFRTSLEQGRTPPPLELSADDLNGFLAGLPEAKITNLFQFRIVHDQLEGEFSVPLDKSGQRKLKGRYLNGLVRFNVSFTDGLLFMTAASVQANGKPIPKWILSRLQRRNLLQDLGQNMETQQLLQNVESIQIKDGAITITPAEIK